MVLVRVPLRARHYGVAPFIPIRLTLFLFDIAQYDAALMQVMKDNGIEKCLSLPEPHTWSAIQRSLNDRLLQQQQQHDDDEAAAAAATTPSFTAKQCRDRWLNHLRPGIVKGNWTKEEKAIIIQMAADDQ